MGASYHADYATILADPDDLPAVAERRRRRPRAVRPTRRTATSDWDVVDLRRLRDDRPGAARARSRRSARRAATQGWEVVRELEDVCPVVTCPAATGTSTSATLDKKARHEIRRKLRRAEAVG